MKSILLTLICLSSALFLQAQNVHLTAWGGGINPEDNCNPNLTETGLKIKFSIIYDGTPEPAKAWISAEDTAGTFYFSQDTTLILQENGVSIREFLFQYVTVPVQHGKNTFFGRAYFVYQGDTLVSEKQPYVINYDTSLCHYATGRVYADLNKNCVFDGNDTVLPAHMLELEFNYDKDVLPVYTGNDGFYSLPLNSQAYYQYLKTRNEIKTGKGYYLGLSCGNSMHKSLNYPPGDTVIDFAYQPDVHTTIYNANIEDVEAGLQCPPLEKTYNMGVSSNIQRADWLFDFGDGHDTLFPDREVKFLYNVSHTYTSPGTFYPHAKVIFEDTVVVIPAYPVEIAANCGNISGMVYRDQDNNCLFDNGTDAPMGQVLVVCRRDSIFSYAYTDTLGRYTFSIPDSVPYEIKLGGTDVNGKMDNHHYGLESCVPAYNRTQLDSALDFGLKCREADKDFMVQIFPGPFRPGFTVPTRISVINKSCISQSGTLRYELDSRETLQSSNPQPSRVTGSTLEWDFGNLTGDQEFAAMIYTQVDSTANIGDTMCHYLLAAPLEGDVDTANNDQNLCTLIRGSFDPNDKTAYLPGKGPTELINLGEHELIYRIRFQNTGTDTAFNIYILDTIDPGLDLTSFHVLHSSHPMRTWIGDDRRIRFEFNNILLPDSFANEPASHGELFYKINRYEYLEIGYKIHNTAHIYFDYNAPVATNTSVVTVDEPLGVSEKEQSSCFGLYPNPAAAEVHVLIYEPVASAEIRLTDLTGRVIRKLELKNSQQITIPVQELSQGLYLLTVDADGRRSTRRVIVSNPGK